MKRVPANGRKATGYAHPRYAEALAEFGAPRTMPESGAPFLERRIQEDTPYRDSMGCYPLFACQDWSRLREDLEKVGEDLVSFAAVADPFGNHDEHYLRECFGDVVSPFKEHFVTDLAYSARDIVSRHHRYYVRKALQGVRVEECPEPTEVLDEWFGLYGSLVARHRLAGIKAFSRRSFAQQLRVPGMVVFRAAAGDETVGMHLWYVSGEVAYSHLAASNARGYELMAAYALHHYAVERFAGKLRWLDLGAGAGVGSGAGGLSRFKKGWSTGTRTAYFCGRVFDRGTYAKLSRKSGATGAGYFPAYRAGELG